MSTKPNNHTKIENTSADVLAVGTETRAAVLRHRHSPKDVLRDYIFIGKSQKVQLKDTPLTN